MVLSSSNWRSFYCFLIAHLFVPVLIFSVLPYLSLSSIVHGFVFLSRLISRYCNTIFSSPSSALPMKLRLPGFYHSLSWKYASMPPLSVTILSWFYVFHFSSLNRCFALLSYNSIIPKFQPFFIKTNRKQLHKGWAKFNQQPVNAVILAEKRRMFGGWGPWPTPPCHLLYLSKYLNNISPSEWHKG